MIRFMNLALEAEERDSLISAILKVFNHGMFINGPELVEFEAKIAKFHQRSFASGVCSGSGALLYAIKALNIKECDEIITTSLSWIATANAIASSGATPVFADINEDLNIDVENIEALITPKTRAIMPVHYAGRVCKIERILEIAKAHNLLVIEDASQAIGARRNGKLAGSFGDIAAFSLNPMKVLGALGEAGVVLSDREEIQKSIERLRYNGTINKETCVEISLNGRMDTLQAAILLQRLESFSNIIAKRREIAYRYHQALEDVVITPKEAKGELNSWYSYTIQAEKRDELKRFLEKAGIETKIQHPILMPLQPAYKKFAKNLDIPKAKEIVQKILCIPAHQKLTQGEQEYIITQIRRFYGR